MTLGGPRLGADLQPHLGEPHTGPHPMGLSLSLRMTWILRIIGRCKGQEITEVREILRRQPYKTMQVDVSTFDGRLDPKVFLD